jgi:hypothetical protein
MAIVVQPDSGFEDWRFSWHEDADGVNRFRCPVCLILPRFHGHLKSHAGAVGVFNHGTEEKVVQRGV